MSALRIALALVLLVAATIGALYLRSPPGLLNVIDRMWPSDAQRVVANARYATGSRHALDVWAVPDGKTGKPVLIFWYGGGWAKGAKEDYGFAARAYAAKGFVVVVPDYRLVPQVVFPAFIEDGALAIRWVRDNIGRFGGDPRRLSLAGHSAGGFEAVMLALDRHYLQAAGVDPAIVRAAAGLSGPYDFYPFTGRAVAAMGRYPDHFATQPITFARADAPPLWLATGTNDTTVKPKNARNLSAKLKSLGATVVIREYPGLDHEDVVMALSRPFRGKATILDESAAFLLAQSAIREPSQAK